MFAQVGCLMNPSYSSKMGLHFCGTGTIYRREVQENHSLCLGGLETPTGSM